MALAAGAAPARADRGALTLEAGGELALSRLAPPLGAGDAVTGSLAGVDLRLRYALTDGLEVTAGGVYGTQAPYVFPGTTLTTTSSGTFTGTLDTRVSRYEALAGVRWLHGLVVRFVVGAEVGWVHTSFAHPDLLNVAAAGGPVSYGLGLSTVSSSQMVIAPSVGLEWDATDRLGVEVLPRLELLVGSHNWEVVVPVTISYSWYGLF